MHVLILKLGATGDVVRTTPLLEKLNADVTWLTAAKNAILLQNLRREVRCFSWEQRESARDTTYDLVINLEDDLDSALFLKTLQFKQLFGAHADSNNSLQYTESSRR